MDLLLAVEGDRQSVGLDSLQRFLRADDELRSVRMRQETVSVAGGPMGVVPDALMLACGSSGVGVAVVQAVVAWLKSRRSTVRVKITTGDRTIEISLETSQDPTVIADLLSAAQTDSGSAIE